MLRRRQLHHGANGKSSSSGAANMPMASIHASSRAASRAVVVQNSRIFRSSAARVVLAVSTAALLIIVLLSAASHNKRVAKVKNLSDTVVDLTRKLQALSKEDETKEREIEHLEHEFEGMKMELSAENQKQHDAYEAMIERDSTMSRQITESREDLMTHVAKENYEMKAILEAEHGENADLRAALARVLEELSAVSADPPQADRGGRSRDTINEELGGEDVDMKVGERKLRGVKPYHPGDSVEIFEEQEGGILALRPGIIHETNPDGTYNVVKIEESIILPNLESNNLQTYQIYPAGTRAMFHYKQSVYIPVTIVRFESGFGLHGQYACMRDYDETGTNGVILVNAALMHRVAEAGETIGADPLLSSET